MLNATRIHLLSLPLFLLNCSDTSECHEEINLLPMYGRQAKCAEQLETDKKFIAECEIQFKDRKTAAKYHIDKGWKYFYSSDYDTSMKRFNQAWLLDSLNADVYWGFGNILGRKQSFQESIPMFSKSIELNSTNPHTHTGIAISYGKLFFQTKDIALLNKSIDNLKTAANLDSTNAKIFGQLALSYSYFMQKDSAKKYLALADKLDPKATNPEWRKMITED